MNGHLYTANYSIHELGAYISQQLKPTSYLALGKISQNQNYDASPKELRNLNSNSKARIKEFVSGRALAQKGLESLGCRDTTISRDPLGCPLWPPTVSGSISHKLPYCGALVSVKNTYLSIGFDIEVAESLDKSVWSAFATETEVNQSELCGIPDSYFANMLFSAKEACFKCLYPIYKSETPPVDKIHIEIKPLKYHIAIKANNAETTCLGGIVVGKKHLLSWAVSS